MGFAAAARDAAVTLLEEYAVDADLKLQVYRARPKSLFPPTAFVDRVSETIDYIGPTTYQRTPRVEVLVLHGTFDTADAVNRRDAFVDGFLDWVNARVHAAGANTTIGLLSVDDEPAWVPDWRPANAENADTIYYATRLTLEGFAGI